MSSGLVSAIFLLILILCNGFLALSEISIVSARKGLLQSRAAMGSKGDKTALDLANSPGNFLSAIQIGITLVGILTGAVGEATIANDLERRMIELGIPASTSGVVSVVVVVVAVAYLTLILGELTPKQIGLIHAEKVAATVAPVINAISWVTRPVVWFLTWSSGLMVRLLGIRSSDEPTVTEEEIKILIDQGTEMGVFEKVEDAIVDQVFRMGDLKTLSITVPRQDIAWLDVNDTLEEQYARLRESHFSIFPVADGDLDKLLGYVSSRDLLSQFLSGAPDGALNGVQLDIRSVIKPPIYVTENSPLFEALKNFRATGEEIAFVIDEYGGVQGLITLQDILNALVEDLPGSAEHQRAQAVQRADGSWLVDGGLAIEDFREQFGLDELPGEAEEVYHTLGGFIMAELGQVPVEGDQLDVGSLHLEVVDMDRRRVDKVLVTTATHPPAG
jgi:putative hemolysin